MNSISERTHFRVDTSQRHTYAIFLLRLKSISLKYQRYGKSVEEPFLPLLDNKYRKGKENKELGFYLNRKKLLIS